MTAETAGRHWWLPLVLIPALTGAIYGRTLGFGFIGFDDVTLIGADFEFLSDWSNIPKAFRRDVFDAGGRSEGIAYYRPLLTLSFMVDAHLGGSRPAVYHLTNLILHAAACCLLHVFLIKMELPWRAAAFFSLIYTAHPVLVQAAAFITARNTSLLTMFALASMIFLIRFRADGKPWSCGLHLFLFACALFTKESGIGLPLVAACMWIFLYGEGVASPRFIALSGGWVAIIAGWLALRGTALTGSAPPELMNMIPNSVVPFQLIGKLMFPFNLSVFPDVADTGLAWAGAGLTATAWILAVSRSVRWGRAAFGAAWFFVFIVPSLIVSGLQGLEFRVYLPGIGFLLILSEADIFKETGARRLPALPAAWAILPLLAVLSFRRGAIFRDARSLWTGVVADSPRAELGYAMLGKYFMEKSEFEAAASVYGRGIARVPRPRNLHNYLGIAYSSQGRLAEAEAQFKEAIRMDPEFVLGIFNLGSIRFRQNRFAEAEVLWRRALELYPEHAAAAHFLAELEKSKGERPRMGRLNSRSRAK